MIYAPFYAHYINLSKEFNLLEGLQSQKVEVIALYETLPKEKLHYQYQVDKWTPKDILLHLIDAERIFAYRALRISRNDKTPLPGFEENDYTAAANANDRTLESLVAEYESVRNATITLFQSFSKDDFDKIGTASTHEVSVLALGYIILGHEIHHVSVIRERYL